VNSTILKLSLTFEPEVQRKNRREKGKRKMKARDG
jgi:hypothetical protein